jgi:hypothetical protein
MKEIVITVEISRDGDGCAPYSRIDIGDLVKLTGRYRFDSQGDMFVEVETPKFRVCLFHTVIFRYGRRTEWVHEDDVWLSEIYICSNN